MQFCTHLFLHDACEIVQITSERSQKEVDMLGCDIKSFITASFTPTYSNLFYSQTDLLILHIKWSLLFPCRNMGMPPSIIPGYFISRNVCVWSIGSMIWVEANGTLGLSEQVLHCSRLISGNDPSRQWQGPAKAWKGILMGLLLFIFLAYLTF